MKRGNEQAESKDSKRQKRDQSNNRINKLEEQTIINQPKRLDNNMLLLIFQYLDLLSFSSCRNVCQRWNQFISFDDSTSLTIQQQHHQRLLFRYCSTVSVTDWRYWDKISMVPSQIKQHVDSIIIPAHCLVIDAQFLSTLTKLSSLSSLTISSPSDCLASYGQWEAEVVARLYYPASQFIWIFENFFQHLIHLEINIQMDSRTTSSLLSRASNLQSLTFVLIDNDGQMIIRTAARFCSKLTQLTIISNLIRVDYFHTILGLTKLTSLSVQCQSYDSEQMFEVLPQLPEMTSLILYISSNLVNKSNIVQFSRILNQCTKLIKLQLQHESIDNVIKFIRKLSEYESVTSITNLILTSQKIINTSNKPRKLNSINDFNNLPIVSLSLFPKLKSLTIDNIDLSSLHSVVNFLSSLPSSVQSINILNHRINVDQIREANRFAEKKGIKLKLEED